MFEEQQPHRGAAGADRGLHTAAALCSFSELQPKTREDAADSGFVDPLPGAQDEV